MCTMTTCLRSRRFSHGSIGDFSGSILSRILTAGWAGWCSPHFSTSWPCLPLRPRPRSRRGAVNIWMPFVPAMPEILFRFGACGRDGSHKRFRLAAVCRDMHSCFLHSNERGRLRRESRTGKGKNQSGGRSESCFVERWRSWRGFRLPALCCGPAHHLCA